jgi:hypothetical protein
VAAARKTGAAAVAAARKKGAVARGAAVAKRQRRTGAVADAPNDPVFKSFYRGG